MATTTATYTTYPDTAPGSVDAARALHTPADWEAMGSADFHQRADACQANGHRHATTSAAVAREIARVRTRFGARRAAELDRLRATRDAVDERAARAYAYARAYRTAAHEQAAAGR